MDYLKNSQVSFWIDSSGGPQEYCKNSFFGTSPKYYLYGSLNEITLEDCEIGAITFIKDNCFDFLEEKTQEEKVNNPKGIFVGYISYDLFKANPKLANYPDFFFAFYESYNNIDSLEHTIQTTDNNSLTPYPLPLTSNMTDEEYLGKVRQIKEEIKAGNVYQVNLTREYSLQITGNEQQAAELDLYLKLRETSPNPYGCFFKTPFATILSSSPEEFLYIGQETTDNRQLTADTNQKPYIIRTRPIKGTLPKGVFEIDPKNKAENLMIVDLERNDLGRICNYGSIKVQRLLDIEKYEHLNHVVSTIEGTLKEDTTLREIFEAVFPGGSITGAPKIRAIKIIDKLEPTPRGAYTGSFGYIKTDGTMNFNILIRTIFITRQEAGSKKQELETSHASCLLPPAHKVGEARSLCERPVSYSIKFNVGGGIVADSDPVSELEEIKLKAKGIINSIGLNSL